MTLMKRRFTKRRGYRLPVNYASGNILRGPVAPFGNTGFAGLYRVPMVSYKLLSERASLEQHHRLADFAYTAEADFSMYRVTRNHGTHFEPELYVTIALDKRDRIPTHSKKRITPRERRRLATAETRALQRLSGALPGADRATTREVQWLLSRPPSRGLVEPRLDGQWDPPAMEVDEGVFEPLGHELLSLVNDPLERRARAVVARSEECPEAWHTVLAMGVTPERTRFPGRELMFAPLEELAFPVDAVVHCRWISNRDAIDWIKKKIRDADISHEDENQGRRAPLSNRRLENRKWARGLLQYLESNEHPPLLVSSLLLALSATDEETLDERVATIRAAYGTVELHRPAGFQVPLFVDTLLRVDAGAVSDYRVVRTREEFGALMPIGTHLAGSRRGRTLGHVANGPSPPVRFDTREASRRRRSPSVLLAGGLGGGKTLSGEWIAYGAWRENARLVDVDPKVDHKLHLVIPDMEIVDLQTSPAGTIDPLVVLPPEMREDAANSMVATLLTGTPSVWGSHVREMITAELADQDRVPCMSSVVDRLEKSKHEDARSAGRALASWAHSSGLTRLLFGDGILIRGEKDARATTIRTRGLSLPQAGVPRSESRLSELISSEVLNLTAAYATRLLFSSRLEHKVMLLDEAWQILDSSEGIRLVDRINRFGRTEDVTLLLLAQLVADPGKIEQLIGTRMLFRPETEEEARRGLALAGRSDAPEVLVNRMLNFEPGRCILQDLDRRVAEVQVDIPDELLEQWKTDPEGSAVAV
jgi:hypothetical protein